MELWIKGVRVEWRGLVCAGWYNWYAEWVGKNHTVYRGCLSMGPVGITVFTERP